MSLGNFTAWSVGRVPFWWSGAYVRATAAIKSGNCGSIKHGNESWGSLLCLVVSGGGSWQNRSCLAAGILGEAIWNSYRFLSKNNFQKKKEKKIIKNRWSVEFIPWKVQYLGNNQLWLSKVPAVHHQEPFALHLQPTFFSGGVTAQKLPTCIWWLMSHQFTSSPCIL